MAIWLAVTVLCTPAQACLSPVPTVSIPNAPRAGEAVLVHTQGAPEDSVVVFVDGVELDGGLVDHTVDGWGWLAWVPEPPLVEGDMVRVEVDEDFRPEGVPAAGLELAVLPDDPRPEAWATVDDVVFGALTPAWFPDCGGPIPAHQDLGVTLSWDAGDDVVRMVVIDADTGERHTRREGDPPGGTLDLTLSFQPGRATACIAVEWLLAEGDVLVSEPMCAINPDPSSVPGTQDPLPEEDGAQVVCGCRAAPGSVAITGWLGLGLFASTAVTGPGHSGRDAG